MSIDVECDPDKLILVSTEKVNEVGRSPLSGGAEAKT